MKLATLLMAVTLGFASASFGQGVVVFDNMSIVENSAPNDSAYLGSTPNSFMGDGYLLTPGTTTITGFDFFPVNGTASTSFIGLNAVVYVWGSVNKGTVNSSTPAFGNLLATYTLAVPSYLIPPPGGYAYPVEGSPAGSAPGLTLPTPLTISGTNIGITVNFEGTTDGVNYSSYDYLTPLVTFSNAPSVGGLDFNGFYYNASSEMNGNFIEGVGSFGYTFQGVGLRVFGIIGPVVPVANPQTVSVLKNTSVNITLTGSDSLGDPLTYSIVNYPANGTLSGTPPNVVYTPNANYTGSDAFTFKVNNGATNSAPAVVSLNVTALAGLIIIPTWDSSILSDPNVASITNTIITTILTYETRFSEPVTVQILFKEMSSGLGMSSTYIDNMSYSTYYNALVANAKTTNDTVVLAHLPGGSSNPVNGGANITAPLPLWRALGFSGELSGTYDSTISLNMSLINITRPPGNPAHYDLQAVASHEIDEVLGTSSGLGQANISPPDLFRFSGPTSRNFTTSGDSAYFSIDNGTTLLAQYNQNSGGDYGDWWSISAHSPVRVQDAFGTPDSAPDLGVELIVLDSVGWTLVSAIPPIVPQPVVHELHSGTTMVLTWNSTVGAIYQVQYTTNLEHTNWVSLGGPITASTTTATNTDASLTDRQRFYRVQILSSPAVVFAPATTSTTQKTSVKGPFGIYKHVTHPRLESNPGSAQVVAPRQLPIQAIPATVEDSP